MRYVDDDGTVVYRASSLGYCPRAFVALANGITSMPAPQWLQTAWAEGVEMESKIIEMLYEIGYVVDNNDSQNEVTLEVRPGLVVKGHIDGIATLGGDQYIVEAKKVAENSWLTATNQAVENNVLYPWQLSVYMHALALPAIFVQGKYSRKKNSIDEICVHLYEAAPISLKDIFKRVVMLERMIDEHHYMDVPCSSPIYPCGWYPLHNEDAPEPPKRLELEPWLVDDAVELEKVQARLRALSAETNELKEKKERLETQLKWWLDSNGMGGAEEYTMELDGRTVLIKRTIFERKEYTVPMTKIDYLTVQTPEAKAEADKKKKEKAAATRKRNQTVAEEGEE
jgi:hypothetical protein